jgi:predicted nucleic acid-binding protein
VNRLFIDTSAYSASTIGHEDIIYRLREADEIYVNAVVLGELLAGFASGNRRERNANTLYRFLDSPRINFVDIDEETAERYSLIHSGLRASGMLIPTNDIWIAASAMQYGLPLLTLDDHFTRIPQIVTVALPER